MSTAPSDNLTQRVREVREDLGVSLRELSSRISQLGGSLNPNALSRIERGERDVKVDELFALAAALGVSPLGLLFAGHDQQMAVTPEVEVDAGRAWLWTRGNHHLGLGDEEHYRRHSNRADLDVYESVVAAETMIAAGETLQALAAEEGAEELEARAGALVKEAHERRQRYVEEMAEVREGLAARRTKLDEPISEKDPRTYHDVQREIAWVGWQSVDEERIAEADDGVAQGRRDPKRVLTDAMMAFREARKLWASGDEEDE